MAAYAEIAKNVGSEHVTVEEIDTIRAIVRRTGSRGYSKNLVEDMTEKAVRAIKESKFRTEAKEILVNIADFIGNREY